jgi:hypothetical protein
MFSRKSVLLLRPAEEEASSRSASSCPRAIKAPQVRKAEATRKPSSGNLIQIRHRDEVEAPITDWLREAYDFAGAPLAKAAGLLRRRRLRKRKKPLRGPFAREVQNALHDLVDRHPGRVDEHRVLRQRERRRGARLVGLIARLNAAAHGRLPRLAARVGGVVARRRARARSRRRRDRS